MRLLTCNLVIKCLVMPSFMITEFGKKEWLLKENAYKLKKELRDPGRGGRIAAALTEVTNLSLHQSQQQYYWPQQLIDIQGLIPLIQSLPFSYGTTGKGTVNSGLTSVVLSIASSSSTSSFSSKSASNSSAKDILDAVFRVYILLILYNNNEYSLIL
ncbi:unnamed protein product [Leptidea sinapis]|uniref:Uncharacterized protein n=1 Tax=Leptidea sinapis TaxID=189913 RepID=A0A5E4QWI4_9NEOP|nr:unnamed protein product [Leptidea sinapis]